MPYTSPIREVSTSTSQRDLTPVKQLRNNTLRYLPNTDDKVKAAVDAIVFGAGILPSDIEVLSVGPLDLVLGLAGTQDRLTLKGFLANTGIDSRIEEFRFA